MVRTVGCWVGVGLVCGGFSLVHLGSTANLHASGTGAFANNRLRALVFTQSEKTAERPGGMLPLTFPSYAVASSSSSGAAVQVAAVPVAAVVPFDDESCLDLTMELENIVDLAEAEQAMKAEFQEEQQRWEYQEMNRARTTMTLIENSMQTTLNIDIARNRAELSAAVATLRSEATAAAATASTQMVLHRSYFQEASQQELEQYHAATRQMCQEAEQVHFAQATHELQSSYNRMFDERSEQIVVQCQSQVVTARAEIETVARQYVYELESQWASQQTVLTSSLA
jgi:hypothetical protein